MVKLRLTRMGSINRPFYRVVAVDSRARRDGKYIDNIGYYDPKTDPATIKLDAEKAIKWLKVGAQPTETVNSLFRKAGILKRWHELKYGKKNETIEETKVIASEEAPIVLTVEEPKKPKKTREKKVKVETVDEPVIENIAPEVVVVEDATAEEAVIAEPAIEVPVLEESNVETPILDDSTEEMVVEVAEESVEIAPEQPEIVEEKAEDMVEEVIVSSENQEDSEGTKEQEETN